MQHWQAGDSNLGNFTMAIVSIFLFWHNVHMWTTERQNKWMTKGAQSGNFQSCVDFVMFHCKVVRFWCRHCRGCKMVFDSNSSECHTCDCLLSKMLKGFSELLKDFLQFAKTQVSPHILHIEMCSNVFINFSENLFSNSLKTFSFNTLHNSHHFKQCFSMILQMLLLGKSSWPNRNCLPMASQFCTQCFLNHKHSWTLTSWLNCWSCCLKTFCFEVFLLFLSLGFLHFPWNLPWNKKPTLVAKNSTFPGMSHWFNPTHLQEN